ncbi:phosphatidate cytidylyltransferase, mitochondrial isoform X4 [Salvia hispanica]|nr:phosphatidate cytidylyltransferase, mitochondrial isoform X4 [Salvia hispanica]XP_047973856.1 phosphatidate cytidylyltransferase, mitochondrial isoform X4 [Salvia hispanica]
MDAGKIPEHTSFLDTLPPVEFACIYGSSLHPNNSDKTSMIDYILGVANPQQWHTENLKLNRDHYVSWMIHLGGAQLITGVADHIGARIHFNPFVSHRDRMFKYGVVRMNDLVRDISGWESFYLSGRLQKPVNVVVDKSEIEKLNSVNVKAATAAALLLLPSKFSEEELYAKICSLSYMGDLRMLFAEDRNKVRKIVQGQFELFQQMYNPFIEEFAAQDLLRMSSSGDQKLNLIQDCGSSTTCSLVSSLPLPLRCHTGMKLGEKKPIDESGTINHWAGRATQKVAIKREEAADCIRKTLRRKVMVSSARQAVAGLLTAGAVHGVKYVGSKMKKAWRSWR